MGLPNEEHGHRSDIVGSGYNVWWMVITGGDMSRGKWDVTTGLID